MQGEEILKEMQKWLGSDAMLTLVKTYRTYPGMVRTAVIRTDDLLTPEQFAFSMERLKEAIDTALATGTDMHPAPGDRALQVMLENMFPSVGAPEEVRERDIHTGRWLGRQMRDYFTAIGATHEGYQPGGHGVVR